jgi:hypothetical protein
MNRYAAKPVDVKAAHVKSLHTSKGSHPVFAGSKRAGKDLHAGFAQH